MHTLGLLAALLSIVASLMAAMLIRNWRHPIILMVCISCASITAIALDVKAFGNAAHAESETVHEPPRVDVARMFQQTYERLRREQAQD